MVFLFKTKEKSAELVEADCGQNQKYRHPEGSFHKQAGLRLGTVPVADTGIRWTAINTPKAEANEQ